MKLIKAVVLIIACLGLVVYLFFPWDLAKRGFWEPAWWQKSIFNFCKYQVPSNYEVISYSEGAPNHKDDNYLILIKDRNTGQIIILSRLRGFHYVPFDQVQINSKHFGESIRFEREHILDNFKVITYLPVWHFLRQDDMAKLPSNVLIKGVAVEEKEEYPTDKANVFYLKGTFTKIGFFKKMPFPWGFATPVFDFLTPQKGALAILNNKEATETIVVVSTVPSHKTFDEETFKQFIQSISFDKEVYKAAFLEGVRSEEIKTKTKISF